ncbi:MAG: DUF732 domain-containing protein [Mycobacterium sp.]
MRDRETIDSELRRIALRRETRGGQLSSREVDELLDERLGHHVRVPEPPAVETGAGATRVVTRPRRTRRRVGASVALPLSLVAAAAVLVVLISHRSPHPAAPPAQSAPPPAAQPAAPAGPGSQTTAQAPPVNIIDTAFVGALKRNGVPVPSRDYAVTQGHAVCDFLARQPTGAPNFTNTVRFVQASTIWDATQSADVAVGAVISYCPQYHLTDPPAQQPDMQKTLNDLQKIQGDLQGIEGDLKGIQGVLPDLPGQH